MKQYDHHTLPLSVSIAPPSTRTLAVVAYAWLDEATGEWKSDAETHPVVSIRAAVEAEYSRRVRPGQLDRPSSAEEARLTGWTHESTNITYNAIVWCDEHDALVAACEAFDAANGAYRVVAADWPPAEDADRLAPVVARLTKDARARADSEWPGKTLAPGIGTSSSCRAPRACTP